MRATRRRPGRPRDKQDAGRAGPQHRDVAVELVGAFGPVLRTRHELHRALEVRGEAQLLAELLRDAVGLDGLLDANAIGLVEVEIGIDLGLGVAGERGERTERGLVVLHRRQPQHLTVGAAEVGRIHAVRRAREVLVVGHPQPSAANHLAAEGQQGHVVEGTQVARARLEQTHQVDGVRRQRGIRVHELAGRIEQRTGRDKRGAARWVRDRIGAAARGRRRHHGGTVERHEGLSRRREMIVGVLGAELQRVAVARLPLQGEGTTHAVTAAELLQGGRLVETCIVELVAVETDAERLRQRQGQAALHFVLVVVGILGGHLATDHIVRVLGDVRDRSSERRAAIERALRALHDLDAFDVHQPRVDQQRTTGGADRLARHIDAIDQGRHVGAPAGRRQTADDDPGVVGGDAAIETERRIAADDPLDVFDTDSLELFGAERRDGERHILQVLLALAGGDHHLLESDVCCGCLRLSGQRHHERQGRDPQGVATIGRIDHSLNP